jgi:hypothetical protein
MFSGIMPYVPNLELGFLYNIGTSVSTGRFTLDYVRPFKLSCDSVIFGEAHTEWLGFWTRPIIYIPSNPNFTVRTSTANNRVDLSFGGGYRRMLGENFLLGVNGFYDASRLFNKWYSSGGVGLETAALLSYDAALDLNFNWYGNLFNRDVLINAFRNNEGSYDVEVGYSHGLFDQTLDLRLKAAAYQFNIGSSVYGWRGGADVTTRNGLLAFRYEHSHDRINGDYDTIGGFVNIGFQLENLLKGVGPFTAPAPVFKSPRNLRRLLGLKVKRDWHQPAAAILARAQGVTPYFVFSLGPIRTGPMTYTQDPGNATGTIHFSPNLGEAFNYSLTLVGTFGLTFPLTATITPINGLSPLIFVRSDGTANQPETVTFPDASTLTRTVPPDGGSGGVFGVPAVISFVFGTAGTIIITAPGVQTLTITIEAP